MDRMESCYLVEDRKVGLNRGENERIAISLTWDKYSTLYFMIESLYITRRVFCRKVVSNN